MKKLNSNDYIALNHILLENNMSRAKLVEVLGLTAPAIFKITKKLFDKKLLISTGKLLPSNGGRPRKVITLNKKYGKILGIFLSEEYLSISISHLNGEIIETRLRKRSYATLQAKLIKMMCDELEYMMEKYGKENIIGVGLAIPGIVDSENGLIKKSTVFKGSNMKITKYIEDIFSIPCVIENNIRAMINAEKLFGTLKNNKDAFFMFFRNGIGSAILINDKIYSGVNYSAGQFNNTYSNTELSLGDYCNDYNIFDRLTKKGMENEMLKISEIFRLASKGESPYMEIITDISKKIGFALANVLNLLDIGKIVISGEEYIKSDYFLNLIKENVRRNVDSNLFSNTIIEYSKLNNDIENLGALSLIINNLFKGRTLIK